MDGTDVKFYVGYSCRLEKMTATYLGRVDRFLSFSQLCLGATAFASLVSLPVVGCLVVALSAFSLVYQPGVKAALAEIQRKQYESLLGRMALLTDEQLYTEFTKIQEADSSEHGALANAAYNGELIRLGKTEDLLKLTRIEKLIAWVAGDLPRLIENKCH